MGPRMDDGWKILTLNTSIDSMGDDRRAVAASEIPVTPEMIAAGAARYIGSEDVTSNGEWLASIYRAMAALAPVELVSAGELAAALERDEVLAENKRQYFHNVEINNAHILEKIGLHVEIAQFRAQLVARDARIAELDTHLALMAIETAADKKPAPATKEFPATALKLSGSDPRRIGG